MPLADPYDDVLPVALDVASDEAMYLLDRHNDVLAVFDLTCDPAVARRIVELINRPGDLKGVPA